MSRSKRFLSSSLESMHEIGEGIVPAGKPQGSRCVGKGALRGEEAEYKTAPGGISASRSAPWIPPHIPRRQTSLLRQSHSDGLQDSAVGSVKERGDAD